MKYLFTESQFKKVLLKVQPTIISNLINEGQNEDQAFSLLKNINNDPTIDGKSEKEIKKIFDKLKNGDKSENHKFLPYIVIFSEFNADQMKDIIETFNKLAPISKKKNIKLSFKIISTNVFSIKIVLGSNEFVVDQDEWYDFKSMVDHLTHLENPESLKIKTNIPQSDLVFQNKKFDVYHLSRHDICVKYIGGPESNQTHSGGDIVGRKYDYCIGWATNTHFDTYRNSGKTFYAVFDKERTYRRSENSQYLDPLVCTIIMVQEDKSLVAYDARDQKNEITDFGDTKGYLNYLEKNDVPLRIFKQSKIDDSTRNFAMLISNYNNEQLFNSLEPKNKIEYISRYAVNLTPNQMKYVLTFLPPTSLEQFLMRIPDLNLDSYLMLPNNTKKMFLDMIITNFATSDRLNLSLLLSYLTDESLSKYVVSRLERAIKGRGVSNETKANKLLGLISPSHFFTNLTNESIIDITPKVYGVSYFPDNFGEYLTNCTELTIDGLHIQDIPSSLSLMTKLTKLTITNCDNLKIIGNSFNTLKNLDTLFIDDVPNFKELPDTIVHCENLSTISITKTSLDHLPNGMDKLHNLFVLNLMNNKITTLPASLSKLSELQFISLSGNMIESIPEQLLSSGITIIRDN